MGEIEATWDFRDPYLWMRKTARSSLPPLIITAAISGGGHGKESNPALPETPEEQAEEARRAYEAGASQIHVHVRDPDDWSQCTGNPDDYGKVNGMIRELCPDVIINNSTGGGPTLTTEERYSPLFADPAPDVATLNLGPFVSKFTMPERPSDLPHPRGPVEYDMCSGTTYGELNHYASVIAERGMKPELEIYDPGQYWVLRDLIYNDNVTPPYMVQFVLGAQTASFPTPANLMSLISELPAGALYSVIGTGPFQIPMNVLGILLGGHVRVGLEDNIYYRRGEKATGNAQLVSRIRRIAEDMNREIATPAQARQMLGLPQVA